VAVAGDYLTALGQTLRHTVDRFAKEMTPEVRHARIAWQHSLNDDLSRQEMVLHAVFENGAASVRDLDRYIRDDIERVGQKLRDVDRKLRQAMEDQVSTAVRSATNQSLMLRNEW
jgi:transcriptional activator SPT7